MLDYENLSNNGISAEELANIFLKDYYGNNISFPIDPFRVLKDLNILFIFRPFKKYEGVYIPCVDNDDISIIGINLKRPIVRQRFTAAHELCHHLKDVHKGFACIANPKSEIECYADAFASEFLMPMTELKKQIATKLKNGYIDFDGVLAIADYFGVSFQACLYKIAYKLHLIEGDTSSKNLQKRAARYKPQIKRTENAWYYTKLYEQLFNAIGNNFNIKPTEHICQKFKAEYILHDSRMEGVSIDEETVGNIVADLRINKQNSSYCKEENKDIVEVAGLTLAYDYAFNKTETINIYDAKRINEILFSTAPCPEYGGLYRQINTLVIGAKFETADYSAISEKMFYLDKDVEKLVKNCNKLSYSDYVECVVRIHHKLTIIHPFRDGNGRTSRVFCNMLFLKKNIPPVFFKKQAKDEYKNALAAVDQTGLYDALYETFFKAILESNAELSDFNI